MGIVTGSASKTCIIGAGPSGLAAAKALADLCLDFDCFEATSQVGGLWASGASPPRGAYDSLYINTSKERMQFVDLPMPAHYPDYPHHTLMGRYFSEYARRFGLYPQVEFHSEVVEASLTETGDWRVLIKNTESGTTKEQRYQALIVANGHHVCPSYPSPPPSGVFSGPILHAHHYKNPREPQTLVGSRVVVVGFGNSAVDIACDLASPGVAEHVILTVRRGAHVIPKYVWGKPVDQTSLLPAWLPRRVRHALNTSLLSLLQGSATSHGLPKPDHRLGSAHPTLSSELLPLMWRGRISIKPKIAHFEGRSVEFADGSRKLVDAIVYATGYKVVFPFFDENFIVAPDNDLPLYQRVFRPGLPNLAFVGLCQPVGALMPIAEAQAKWVAAYLAGEVALPSQRVMESRLAADRRALEKRYVASPRHTMQVDFDTYLAGLAQERAVGKKRAERGEGEIFAAKPRDSARTRERSSTRP